MREIKRTTEIREGKNWIETYTTTDKTEIYESLSSDLISKKLCGCQYIKSIKRTPNYDGTCTVVVTYNNNSRNVYIVKG